MSLIQTFRESWLVIGSVGVRLKFLEGTRVVDGVGGNSKRGLKWGGGCH